MEIINKRKKTKKFFRTKKGQMPTKSTLKKSFHQKNKLRTEKECFKTTNKRINNLVTYLKPKIQYI